MTESQKTTEKPDVRELLGLFPNPDFRPESAEIVKPEDIPEPYRSLLVHEHHMTVTLERHHQSEIHLVVRDRKWQGSVYCRRLLLTAGEQGKVVLVGAIRFHMSRCTQAVQKDVREENIPLGKILMEHCSLRTIRPYAYLRVRLEDGLRRLFAPASEARYTYGRTAVITCQLQPVVELLEVVCPEPEEAPRALEGLYTLGRGT